MILTAFRKFQCVILLLKLKRKFIAQEDFCALWKFWKNISLKFNVYLWRAFNFVKRKWPHVLRFQILKLNHYIFPLLVLSILPILLCNAHCLPEAGDSDAAHEIRLIGCCILLNVVPKTVPLSGSSRSPLDRLAVDWFEYFPLSVINLVFIIVDVFKISFCFAKSLFFTLIISIVQFLL